MQIPTPLLDRASWATTCLSIASTTLSMVVTLVEPVSIDGIFGMTVTVVVAGHLAISAMISWIGLATLTLLQQGVIISLQILEFGVLRDLWNWRWTLNLIFN